MSDGRDVRVGQEVLLDGHRRGRVASTSGTDRTCVVRFPDGRMTGWVGMDRVRPAPAEGENERRAW